MYYIYNLIFSGHLEKEILLKKDVVMRGKVLESQIVQWVGGFIISI